MFGEAGQKLLHRARSLRRLRPHDEACHQRGISISSDDSRATSSGSDTSRRGNSVEWDPLRLHPSMDFDMSPHITPTPVYHQARHDQDHHHSPAARHTPPPALRVQVYDGFDFGFAKAAAAAPVSSSPPPTAARQLRAPKSEADLRRHKPQPWASNSPTRRTPPHDLNEVDFFIKRGGWKRRGIVFGGHTEPSARPDESEDDAFDL